ncbi:MAG: helix-turn-helix transcriptional regulator [Clostridiales bacterium]|nr:helix-turn-helix transcriptional regulator [Clostridiales bacterium]
MNISILMKEKKMTKYRLSKNSDIPYTTIGDICNGKTDLKKCSAETIYKLAKALGISMEELLSDAMAERPSFELFKSHVCHRVKEQGDVTFLIETLQSNEIRTYFDRKWYPESLYLLGMLDYLCRVNEIPLCNEYDDLRHCRLSETIYPSSILAVSAAAKNDQAKLASLKAAIPEFLRFNIVESEVRNVI